MPRYTSTVAFVCLLTGAVTSHLNAADLTPSPIQFESTDWPWWRGPARNGIAAANQDPPLNWSRSENVLWRSPVPGRRHGSVTLVGDQLFLATADEQADKQIVLCFDRDTGKRLWQTVVHDGAIARKGNKKAKNHMSAVRADGSGEIVWENNVRVYVPSMLIHDGTLYGVTDAGVAMCWEAATGKPLWRRRLGGTFSSSPVMVGPRIYVTNEAGETFVFHADPAKFELIAKNQLGNEVIATPTICGSRVYSRVVEQHEGRRQEMLYCIGEE